MDNRNLPHHDYWHNLIRESGQDTRLVYILCELMEQYNYTVRSNDIRFHDNMSSFIRMIQSTQNNIIQQQRTQSRSQFSNTNTNNRHTFYTTPPFRESLYTNIINETVQNMLPNLFQDVLVFATQQQINNATDTFLFRSEDMTQIVCPITQEEFQDNDSVCQIRHCGHTFKELAIKNWFRQNVRCPVCRYDIRTNNPTDPGNDETPDVLPTPSTATLPSTNLPTGRNGQRTSNASNIDRIFQNLSNGIQNVVSNYMDREMGTDNTQNRVFTFDLPIYIYNDLSGNY